MKKRLITFAAISALPMIIQMGSQASDLEKQQTTVALLRIHRSNRSDETAAAIFVGNNEQSAYFVTAAHVLTKVPNDFDSGLLDSVNLQFKGHPEPANARVLPNFDGELDLGVVKVSVTDLPPNIHKLTMREPSLEMAVHIIGHPPGGSWSLWIGIVQNQNASNGDVHHFITNTDQSLVQGYSGGAVYDGVGNLVGMHNGAALSYGKNLKTTDIARQLAGWNVPTNNLVRTQNVSVSIVPQQHRPMRFRETQKYGAIVTGADDTSVAWSATFGTIRQDGTFAAGTDSGTATITATSKANPTVSASTQVQIEPAVYKCKLVVNGVQAGWKLDAQWRLDDNKQHPLKMSDLAGDEQTFDCSSGDHTVSVQLTALPKGYFQIGGSKQQQRCALSFTISNHGKTLVVDPQIGQTECDLSERP